MELLRPHCNITRPWNHGQGIGLADLIESFPKINKGCLGLMVMSTYVANLLMPSDKDADGV